MIMTYEQIALGARFEGLMLPLPEHQAKAATTAQPRRCMHHRAYPDSAGYCRGESSDYCETDVDAIRRAIRSAERLTKAQAKAREELEAQAARAEVVAEWIREACETPPPAPDAPVEPAFGRQEIAEARQAAARTGAAS
jgi:hypothetical protein